MGKSVYLVMVTTMNNNKFYEMTETGDGYFSVKYGRIGNTSFQTARYSMSQWHTKYDEKVRKGYVDQTHLKEEPVVVAAPQDDYKPILNKYAAEIVQKLMSFATQMIARHYQVSRKNVTQKMVDEAQRQISRMMRINSLYEFNEELLKLFMIIPRQMSQVKIFLAESAADFSRILEREQDLLDVMAGEVTKPVVVNAPKTGATHDQTVLEALGLDIDKANDADIAMLKKMMGDQSYLFNKAWKVNNSSTEEKFQKCLKDEKIKATKLLFHGSRNENWWNIAKSGLLLNPGRVQTTGSMFGHGLYFAPKARKSMGYTSLENSYWANGNSDVAYLAIYEVAYGKPYDVYDFNTSYYSLNQSTMKSKKTNCLHAHADKGMLHNDEIVVYNETQATIRYLIECKKK